MDNYLDDIFDSLKSIRSVAQDLQALSSAFDVIGNDKVSKELYLSMKVLMATSETISGAVGKELNRRVGSAP